MRLIESYLLHMLYTLVQYVQDEGFIPSLFIGIAMAFNRPDENEKKLFIEKFSHLTNWFPHLTLEETIKKSQELMSNSLV